ncbi:hypothetical protein C5Q97_01960 [Victivallales bacterium CCUG 44730]|nr:hypothetical protein C5Q97_01960 [Victivallales bacterium CCUG 44730]
MDDYGRLGKMFLDVLPRMITIFEFGTFVVSPIVNIQHKLKHLVHLILSCFSSALETRNRVIHIIIVSFCRLIRLPKLSSRGDSPVKTPVRS